MAELLGSINDDIKDIVQKNYMELPKDKCSEDEKENRERKTEIITNI